jgi:hypothetical protein
LLRDYACVETKLIRVNKCLSHLHKNVSTHIKKVYNSINVMFATILKITTISCDVRDEIKNVYNIKRKTNVNEE